MGQEVRRLVFRQRRLRFLAPLFWLAACAAEDAPPAPAAGQAVARIAAAVCLPERAPECVRWAAGEVVNALARAKVPGADGPRAGSIRVLVDPKPAENPIAAKLPAPPEAFALELAQDGTIAVAGRDATGAMYGLLELAEQLALAPSAEDWPRFFAAIAPDSGKPAIPVRAENIFLHADPSGKLLPWFYDEAYWTGYLALLAKSRFNLLDIHGVYSPATTVFWNTLPFFTSVPCTIKIGDDSATNIAMLRRIVALAAARGIRVGLMNYQNAPRSEPDVTSDRVQALIRDCPGLAMLGLRVKREGDAALDPFKKYLLANTMGFTGDYYTRSWGTDLDTIRRMAKLCPGRLVVEVKFNGEHLGLPYPAIQGWGEDYSYQAYLQRPRPFDVLWQIRANGTHRVFPWADPDFVRRAVAAIPLGGTKGFSLESPTAYFPPETAARYRAGLGADAAQPPAAKYLFESRFGWQTVWGRLAYDPATPRASLARPFHVRYGAKAGAAAFKALTTASRMLPRVYASYAFGVDHRDAAPELEFGAATRDMKQQRGLDDLAAIQPLDRMRMSSPLECADALVSNRFDARISPLESAAALGEDAANSERAAAELLEALEGAREPAGLRTLALETRALAALGRSHAERLRALTYYALAAKTGDARWLAKSRESMANALARWQDLSTLADAAYLPFNDPLRMGNGYTWASQLPQFGRLLAQLDKLASKNKKKKSKNEGALEPALPDHFERARLADPVLDVSRKKNGLRVALRFPEGAAVPARAALVACPLDSEAPWEAKELEWDAKARAFAGDRSEPSSGLLYFFQGADAQGRPWLWPDPEKALPYFSSR